MEKTTGSVFDERMANLDSEEYENQLFDQLGSDFESADKTVINAEVVDLDEGEASSRPSLNSSKRTTKRKKILIYAVGGLAVFAVLVVVFAPTKNTSQQKGVSQTQDEHAVTNNMSNTPGSTVTSMSSLVAQPPVAQPPVAQPPVAQPPVAQPPVAQPPVAQPLSVSDSSVGKGESGSEGRVQEVLAELERVKTEMDKLKKQMSSQPRTSNRTANSKSPTFIGYAIGVVQILEDGVVYEDRNKELHVVKIGESYRKYGVLKSVNPKDQSYVTTRGLWRIK